MSSRPRRRRQKRSAPEPTPSGPDQRLEFDRTSALLVGGGVVLAVVGFWVLSTGSISLAPALLVIAYLVLIPVGLALPKRNGADGRKEGGERKGAG